MELLKEIAISGKLVICVTHSEKVASNCTRVLNMDEGNIVSDTASKSYKTKSREEEKPYETKDNIDRKEIFTFAKNNVMGSFKRSLLVSVALGIGICSFVLMLFLGAGLQRYVETTMETGVNKLQVNVQKEDLGTFTVTEISNLENLLDSVSGVYQAIAVSDLKAEYKIGTSYNRLLYMASTYEDFQMTLQSGRLPDAAAGNEILISSVMSAKLGSSATVTLRYDGKAEIAFTIVGVFEDDSYDSAYVSLNSMKTLVGSSSVNMLYVIAKKVAYINGLIDDIQSLIPNAVVTRLDTSAEDLMEYINLGSLMLSIVSLVALIVSAIMIFIVMYISVIERTKEIGILRALGTRRKDIKKIFVTEGGIIGTAAGIIGCVFALIISLLANLATMSVAKGGIMSINPLYLLLGFAVSFILSIVASMGPSGSGANLDPVEALRSE